MFAWRLGIAAYALGLSVAGLSVSYLMWLASTLLPQPPVELLVAVAVGPLALHASGDRLPESSWRIPRTWERLGRVPIAGIFGLTLGAGVLTAVPSAAFYVLCAWALLSAGPFLAVAAIFGAFAAGRVLPLILVCIVSRRRAEYPVATLERFTGALSPLAHVELALIAALGGLLLASSLG